ncbi:F0F1 ATP synthase subunit B [Patescibacteria group bacterium]|nr:F0F1 ATP synthase subunit B [Patescibacteria group bacterium]
MELIEKLGLDWRLLIAQIVNFFILLFVLYRFAYRPILRMLEKRTQTIEKSLADAKQIELNLADTEKKRDEVLNQARLEARKMVDETNQQAEKLRDSKIQSVNQEVETMIQSAKQEITQTRERMVKEVKDEVADLVIQTTKKVLERKIDEPDHRRLIDQTISELTVQKK